jgi:hypothetical protein
MTTPGSTSLRQREPALVYGGGLTGASLVIDTIVGLGIPLSSTARIVIILAVSVVGPMLGTWLTRSKVVSPATLAGLGKDAKEALADLQGLHAEVCQRSTEKIAPAPAPTLGSDGVSR